MSALWNRTLYYLGLADEGEGSTVTVDASGGAVRPVSLDRSEADRSEADRSEADRSEAPASPGQVSPQELQSAKLVQKPGAGVVGRRIEPPSAVRRRMSDDPVHAEAGVYLHPSARPASTAEMPARWKEPEAHIISARNFSDAQVLADSLQTGRSVVLDLRSTEPEMVRRIVDFASGLTYALDGKMVKTTQGVILVTPSGVSLGAVEQERLMKLGLFDAQS